MQARNSPMALTTLLYFAWENSAASVLMMALERSMFDCALFQLIEPRCPELS